MNLIIKKYAIAALVTLAAAPVLTSCDEYINVLPKGEKYPTTFADYAPLLNNEYTAHQTSLENPLYLMNDRMLSSYYLSTDNINRANFLWDESADRVALNSGSESFFYQSYAGINTYNLLIERIPGSTNATQAEKDELVGQARVLRAYSFFMLANFYAEPYDKATAAQKGGIPLIYSADTDAPYKQESLATVYDFVVSELTDVLNSGVLPEKSKAIIHPNKAAAQAMLARVYLNMGEFDKALAMADEALKYNSALFDWNAFYVANQEQIDAAGIYPQNPSPLGHNFVENIYFRSADNSPNYTTLDKQMPVDRAQKFEAGDTHLKSRWKYKLSGGSEYYEGIVKGYFNKAGITTPELYLIKAECLARAGKVSDAMDLVNTVRKVRVLPEVYADLTATDAKDAIAKIIEVKDNALVQTLVPFIDARRLNTEGTMLVRTFTKTVNGVTYTLRPDSHLWTMVFPMGAVNNHGNGTLTQNSK